MKLAILIALFLAVSTPCAALAQGPGGRGDPPRPTDPSPPGLFAADTRGAAGAGMAALPTSVGSDATPAARSPCGPPHRAELPYGAGYEARQWGRGWGRGRGR